MFNAAMTPPFAPSAITMPETIVTPRAVLRKVSDRDAAALSEHISDYDIAKMMGSIPYPMPRVSAEVWLLINKAAWNRGLRFNYALYPRDCGALRGIVGFFKTKSGAWELGYWVSRTLWGQGYATEACAAALETFEATNGPTPIHADVFKDNPASARVLEKLGFVCMGDSPDLFSMARLAKSPGLAFLREPSHET